MIRDFTEGTKELILEVVSDVFDKSSRNKTYTAIQAINAISNWDNSTITSEYNTYQNREDDISFQEQRVREYVETIFENARNYDNQFSETIEERIAVPADPYIQTLEALADKIDVSSLGNDATSVRYNFGRYHGGYESSIFGEYNSFSSSLESIGYGYLEDVYNLLNPDINGWDYIDTLMSKDPSEVTLCEIRAMSMYLDTFIILDKNGIATVNYDKYEEFLEHAYTLIKFNEAIVQPDAMLTSYTEFSLSPVLSMLASYRSQFTQKIMQTYGEWLYTCSGNSPEISFLNAECQIDDILTGVCLYGETIIEDGLCYRKERPDFSISIEPLGNDSKDITISLWNKKDINIYGLTTNLGNEYATAVNNAVDTGYIDPESALASSTMTAFLDITLGTAIGSISTVGTGAGIAYSFCNACYGSYSAYQDALNENALRDQYIYDVTNQDYIARLYLGGTVIQCEDEMSLGHVFFNENMLMLDVAFYNEYNEDITIGELKRDYQKFMLGEKAEILDKFSDFDNGDTGNDYSIYQSKIKHELEQIRQERIDAGEKLSADIDISSATREEILEAIERISE